MKSLFTILFTFYCFFTSHGQVSNMYFINGLPLDSIQAEYIEAETCRVAFSTKVFLDIDYGQESKILYNKYNRVADTTGDYIEFKSNMDALNYLSSIGYELIDTDYLRMKDDEIRVKYMLKKKGK
ncbi:MAG TPA: hypothetical protein PKD51_14855 [Saprospiraceae bacterium]|nr:hypothetical protein [Saprospiraceae bacterium]HMU03556.1 hypothetical protein [Saprospiraceae bacterium]